METITKFEEIARNKEDKLPDGINRDLYWGYHESRNAGADEINLSDVNRENDVDRIIENCKRFSIERITFSSTWSRAMGIVWEFVKRGCAIEGMKEVPLDSYDYDPDTNEKIQRKKPAIIIRIAK